MKIDLSGVSETLLVTLYMRAKDAKSNHPFLNDRKAAEIISCMDYDFSAFDRVWMSYYGLWRITRDVWWYLWAAGWIPGLTA